MSKAYTLVILVLSLVTAILAQAQEARCTYKIQGTVSSKGALDALVDGMTENHYILDENNGKYVLEVTPVDGDFAGSGLGYVKKMYSANTTLSLFDLEKKLLSMAKGQTSGVVFAGASVTYTSDMESMKVAVKKISDCNAIQPLR
jgi:hypothetical protein